MVLNILMLKQFIQNLSKTRNVNDVEDSIHAGGFTVLELLVTLLVGMLVMVIGFSTLITVRGAFVDDIRRISSNQNSRGALDIIGIATREAGENLDPHFPAVEIQQDGENSILVIRRNLLDEVLKLCTAIDQGSSNTQIFFAVPGTKQGCIRTDQIHNYSAWNAFRIKSNGNVRAYIYDSSTKEGEFFDYNSEVDTGSSLYLVSSAHTWAHDYTDTSGAVYILEEWRFVMNGDLLQVIENGQNDNPLNIAHGFQKFHAEIMLSNNSVVNTFTKDNNWTNIKGVRVSIKGAEVSTAKGKNTYSNVVSAQFFPRNILSH